MKSAVFLDIDHTIWDGARIIPESVAPALERLRKNGHLVFLNSGRSRGHIRDKRLLALALDGIVGACGNYIEIGGRVVYEHCLDEETIRLVFAVSHDAKLPVILEGSKDLFFHPEDFPGDQYVARLWQDLGAHARRPDTLTKDDRINKFSAAISEETDVAQVKERLLPAFDLLDHNGRVVEFIPKGSGKDKGIAMVEEILQIAHENTYAIGDSVNDLAMLAYAGHGIAMGNGEACAKEVAEYVTKDLHEDGLSHALSRYGLI